MLPRTRLCDRLWHRAVFKRIHGRAPVLGATMINDYLYRLRTSREIEGPLRVAVSDKELVKGFIAQHVGNQFNVPTIAVLRSYTRLYDTIIQASALSNRHTPPLRSSFGAMPRR